MPAANPDVRDTGSPPIPEAASWLAAYRGEHGPALRLSQAAPGTPPPPALLDVLARAAGDAATASYGAITGDDDLRVVFAAHVSDLYGATIPPDDIAITGGCNQAFVAALLAVARAGDAILLPEPWYFNHEATARMFGIEVRALPCRADAGFVPDLDDARQRIADGRVKAIVLVTPNNPTGAIYAPATIRAFGELARANRCWLILDETYRDFLDAPAARPHDLFADADLAAVTLQLYSFSKAYAVPGHRLGALRAPRALSSEIGKILDNLQICAPRAGQRALVWAIPELAAWRETNRVLMVERGQAFRAALASVPAWRIRSLGAYFAYVEHPFAGLGGHDVARRLAMERGVLALPGTFFGSAAQAPYLRVAFGNADTTAIQSLGSRLPRW